MRTALLLTLVLATSAHAQDKENLELTKSGGPDAVGIDNCAERINEAFTLRGELNGDFSGTWDLWITWTTESSGPDVEDFGGDCSVGDGDDSFGCLQNDLSTSSTSITRTGLSLAELPRADLCDAEGPDRVSFYFHYVSLADEEDETGDDTTVTDDPITIEIDRTRPPKPELPPTITPRENALEIDVAALTGTDRYEICVKEKSAEVVEPVADDESADQTLDGNEARREGFTDCRSRPLSDFPYRFEGLENGVVYQVVYAGIDAADNRGANSEPAEGSPSEVQDFAEIYTAAGGTETGGCANVGSAPTAWTALFLGLALAFRTRRRPRR